MNLYNDGYVPVYIKEVVLSWGKEGEELGNTVNSLFFETQADQANPLKPGEGRKYCLSAMPSVLLKKAGESEDGLWVSVKSAKGEVLRISTPEVREYVNGIVSEESND